MFTGFLLHRRNANRAPSTGGQASRNRFRANETEEKKKSYECMRGLVVEGVENVVKIEIDGAGIVCARNLRRERNEYLSHRLSRLFLFDITSRRRRYSNQAFEFILSNPGVKMACALKRANGNKGGDDNKNVRWWNLIVKRRFRMIGVFQHDASIAPFRRSHARRCILFCPRFLVPCSSVFESCERAA